MTVGSLRDQTTRWLQIAALVVIAFVLVRTVTSPRVLTSMAGTPAAQIGVAETIAGLETAATSESAVEARPVRRARHVQSGPVPHLAVVLFAALAAVAAATRRRSTHAAPALASRAVPVLGGRGPPPLLH